MIPRHKTPRKGAKISRHVHKHAGEFFVRYDKAAHIFFVQVSPTETIEDADERACKRKADARLTELCSYVWKPVILVQAPDYEKGRHSFGGRHFQKDNESNFTFRFERVELADHPSGDRRVQRTHPLDAEDILDKAAHERWEKGLSAELFHDYGEELELPYSQETWDGLCHLRDMLDALRERLHLLLNQESPQALAADFLTKLAKQKPALNLLESDATPRKKAGR